MEVDPENSPAPSVGDLTAPNGRPALAAQLAEHVGARHLSVWVQREDETLRIASGFESVEQHFDEITEVLELAKTPGTHTWPGDGKPRAIARHVDGVVLVFLDGAPDVKRIDGLVANWALVHRVFVAEIARDENAALVAESLANERGARAEAASLARIVDVLNSPNQELESLVQAVTDEATAATNAAFGAFFYNAESETTGEMYQLYTLSGAPREAFERFGMPRNTPLFSTTFSGEGVVRLGNVAEDARYGKMEPHHGMPEGHLPVTSYLAVPVIAKDGEVIGGLFLGHPEPDRFTADHERVVHALASSAAVAMTRHRAEAATRASELQLRTISDALPTLVSFLDCDIRYRFANASYKRWFGVDPATLVGRTPGEVFGPEATNHLLPYAQKASEGTPTHYTSTLAIGGVPRNIEGRFVPVRESGGEVTGVVGLVTDISERVRHQAKERALAEATSMLLESEDMAETIEAIAMLVARELADWCVLHVEDRGTSHRVVMQREAEEDGKVRRIEEPWSANPNNATGTHAVIRTGKAILVPDVDDSTVRQFAQSAEHLQKLRAAGVRSYLCVPLRARHNVIGALALVSATPGRPFDTQDQAIAQELADRVALRIENARLYREAESASRAKDHFLAMLGHELRNPLAPMLTGVQLLKDRFEQEPRELEIIERQLQHMVRLVDDLLDVSRITRGMMHIRSEAVNISRVVDRSLEACSPLLDERGHHVKVEVANDLWVCGDEDRLVQVLSNLLTNAAKYTQPRGHIYVSGRADVDEVEISVADDGAGIPPAILSRLFDAFIQGSSTLDRADGGLGLGLAIVRTLIAMHQGTIEAHSDGPGGGSKFTIRLPSMSPQMREKASTPMPTPAKPEAVARRILVVDDNRDAAELFAEALAVTGHDTRIAFDGPEALRVAEEFSPDLALLDIGLPVMDGLELARRLRELPGLDAIKLIAVTGYGQDSDRRRSRDAGFDEHIVKPVSLEQVHECLERLFP